MGIACPAPLTYVLYMLSMALYMSATAGRAEVAEGISQRPGDPGRGRGIERFRPSEVRRGRK